MAPRKSASTSIQTISVIVPANPFIPTGADVSHCLAALDVEKLMEWWPGRPHAPHRRADKVRAIQRSLDWKRVVQIAAYLLQDEIVDAQGRVVQYFEDVYGATAGEPGREWPPKLPRVAKFQRSEYPTFSNVLLHVNGAKVESVAQGTSAAGETATLVFDENDISLNFSVIDGQHRINGAYLAVRILREKREDANWQIPSEIFLNLDPPGSAPRRQAQIFIDVNAYQKKVDRSLVADLFPTARGSRGSLDDKERAQDVGRKLMLETGPLVGMIQIPGIRYGVKDVVTLATLNAAIEDTLGDLYRAGINGLDAQTDFLAACLDAWLEATGRKEDLVGDTLLSAENVAYQGRAIVSFLTLIPACILQLRRASITPLVSAETAKVLEEFLRGVMKRSGLVSNNKFLSKSEFKSKGYLGSGGLARFRDSLWAAVGGKKITDQMDPDRVALYASNSRAFVRKELQQTDAD